MVYAFSGTPNPLYGVVGPEYTNLIHGNAPQVDSDALYLAGLTPTILRVLSSLDAISYEKCSSKNIGIFIFYVFAFIP